MDIGDYDGRTALHLACSENQTKIVEYLLKNGV
jgi:glutaminase